MYTRSDCHETSEVLRQIVRLHALLKTRPCLALKEFKMYDGTTRSFHNFVSYAEEIKRGRKLSNFIPQLANQLSATLKDYPQLCTMFFKYAGIWNINAIDIPAEEDAKEILGAAIYLRASYFDHACGPTAFFRFLGQSHELEVRAIHQIESNDAPRVCYLKSYLRKEERVASQVTIGYRIYMESL